MSVMVNAQGQPFSALPASRRRRWYQFGLRTVFLLTTAVIGFLVLWRICIEPYRRQRAAVEVIKQVYGTCQTSEARSWHRWLLGDDLRNITLADLADCDQVDRYLPHVASLPCLETLVVGGDAFHDGHLQRLQTPMLQQLVLDSTSVSDATLAAWREMHPAVCVRRSQRRAIAALRAQGVEIGSEQADEDASAAAIPREHFEVARHGRPQRDYSDALGYGMRHVNLSRSLCDARIPLLARLPSLRSIDLDDTSICDDGLSGIAKLSGLESIQLDRTRVGDAGVIWLAGLRNLQWLYLADTQVTDAGVAALRGLTRLKWLDLDGTKITDVGLAHLRGLPIEHLSVCRTAVSDAGLAALRHAAPLKDLRVVGSAVTVDGVARFRAAHPQCFVQGPFAQ
jgi:hypothetical protein